MHIYAILVSTAGDASWCLQETNSYNLYPVLYFLESNHSLTQSLECKMKVRYSL